MSTLELLAEENTLAAESDGKILLKINVIPTSGGPYQNSSVASATHPTEDVIIDQSQNGTDPDPDGDGNPNLNSDPTPVEFGAGLFDPPMGIKTVDASGRPLFEWTMVWINHSNIVGVNGFVSDPIPVNTEFAPTLVSSGFDVPIGAPPESTNLGVICEAAGVSVTRLCYYEGPTLPDFPRGRIIWEGTVGPDFGVTKPKTAQNAVTIKFNILLANGIKRVTNRATIDSDRNGDGDTLDLNEFSVAVASKAWSAAKNDPLPATGFAPGVITSLPSQPRGLKYSELQDINLEIPALGITLPIVGVPGI